MFEAQPTGLFRAPESKKLPLRLEVFLRVNNHEQLIGRFGTVTSIKIVLKRNRSFLCTYNEHFPFLCSPAKCNETPIELLKLISIS